MAHMPCTSGRGPVGRCWANVKAMGSGGFDLHGGLITGGLEELRTFRSAAGALLAHASDKIVEEQNQNLHRK